MDYDLIGQPTPSDLLIEAGRKIGVPSITQTPPHPFMMEQALKQATYQADTDILGHQHFDCRSAETMKQFPGCSVSEICAESWEGQSAAESADDAYKCWRQSPGHWKECNAPHSYYGYAMVQSRRTGIWYSCGHFCDGVTTVNPTPLIPTPTPEPNHGWLWRLFHRKGN